MAIWQSSMRAPAPLGYALATTLAETDRLGASTILGSWHSLLTAEDLMLTVLEESGTQVATDLGGVVACVWTSVPLRQPCRALFLYRRCYQRKRALEWDDEAPHPERPPIEV